MCVHVVCLVGCRYGGSSQALREPRLLSPHIGSQLESAARSQGRILGSKPWLGPLSVTGRIQGVQGRRPLSGAMRTFASSVLGLISYYYYFPLYLPRLCLSRPGGPTIWGVVPSINPSCCTWEGLHAIAGVSPLKEKPGGAGRKAPGTVMWTTVSSSTRISNFIMIRVVPGPLATAPFFSSGRRKR